MLPLHHDEMTKLVPGAGFDPASRGFQPRASPTKLPGAACTRARHRTIYGAEAASCLTREYGGSNGIRTRVSDVTGRCPNHWTMEPWWNRRESNPRITVASRALSQLSYDPELSGNLEPEARVELCA